MKKLILFVLILVMSGLVSAASASTIAYWRFEPDDPGIDFSEGLASEVAAGNLLPDVNDQNGWDEGLWRRAAYDWSGNGNHLTTWESPWAGWMWALEVPAGIVPITGELNELSVQNGGDYPAMMTWSAQSSPTLDAETIQPEQFTIEASFYLTGPSSYRTIVGRDAYNADPSNGDNAAVYFQIEPGGDLALKYLDIGGVFHVCTSANGLIVQNRWYNAAAVSDGSTVTLYLEDCLAGTGMQQVGTLDLTASGSGDTSLANGSAGDPNGTNWIAGGWSVGRGIYGGNHGDRWLGYIDEVRISNIALNPSEFLFYPGPSRSYAPDPAQRSIGASTSVELSWTPVSWADAHDVYFGNNYNDVRDANRSDQTGVIYYEEGYDSNSYPLPSLELGQYYWRIDDVDGADVFRGTVWDFRIISAELSVSPTNRYSFIDGDTVAVDDIGGEDGAFDGTATLANNQLALDGGGSVHLPGDILDTDLTSLTIEVWFEVSSDAWWQRVFDFGSSVGAGRNYLFYTSASWHGSTMVLGTEGSEISADAANIPVNTMTHIACVYDGTTDPDQIRYYLNGQLSATTNVGTFTIANIDRVLAYIGDSVYSWDPYMTGAVEEFRIYDVALDINDVQSSYLAGPDVYRATNPSPAHDASTSQDVTLKWTAGAKAATHDVYVDTDKAVVVGASRTNQNSDICQINWSSTSYSLGGLDIDQTYYWRIDEANGTDLWRGNIWSFTVSPLKASAPSPYNGEVAVSYDPSTVLSWKGGGAAAESRLLFGTNSGNLVPQVTIPHTGSERYSHTMIDANQLNPDTVYYWRVDEVNDGNTWPGDQWTFTTIPEITQEDPNLVGWWKFNEGPDKAIDWSGLNQHGTIYGGAGYVEGYEGGAISFDGSNDYVSLPIGNTISTLDSVTVALWVNFENGDQSWQRIWDFGNGSGTGYMFLTPRTGTDGPLRFAITTTTYDNESVVAAGYTLPEGWHHVAVVIDDVTSELYLYLDGAEVDYNLTMFLPSDLGVTTQNWLGRSQYSADGYYLGLLDDVRIYNYAMTQQEIKEIMASKMASNPDPANYATGVYRYPILSWEPGVYADNIEGHELYYGTDFNDVNERVGDPVVLTSPTYTIPAPNVPYESLEVIYWVVDEVNDSHPDLKWPGNVWRFTIRDASLIDNFDTYTGTGKSQPPPEGTLKSVWVDGNYTFDVDYLVPGTSGSLVQLNTDPADRYYIYPNYVHYVPDDEDIAQSDAQSMKFYYDNDGTVEWEVYLYGGYPEVDYTYSPVPDKYLSEAYAAVDDAAAGSGLDSLDMLRDWSIYNVLGLSFYGDVNNTTNHAGLYVGLKDADGTLVTIAHPDPTLLVEQSWHDWYVKLSDFTDKNIGLDTEHIVRIYLGFGDKDSPASGGSGVVFFDDIQLFTGICIPGSVAGDFDDDCTVNNSDLEIFTYQFPGQTPTLPAPIIELVATGTVGNDVTSWKNTADNTYFKDVDTSDSNNPVVDMILDKKCVTFDDVANALVWDNNAPATLTSDTNEPNDYTVIYEVYNPEIGDEEWLLTWAQRGGPAGTTAGFGYGSNAAWAAVVHWNEGSEYPDMGFDLGVPAAGQWHVIAATYDGTTNAVIVDGLVHGLEDKDLLVRMDQPVTVGAGYQGTSDADNADILGTYDMTYSLRFTGSVASIRVYGEAVPPGDLAIVTAGLSRAKADLKPDGKIDFKDLAVMGYKWMEDPYLFGEDY